ncbi:MAG: phosphodiester glycosidase family protein [Eubacteriales bacterium]|nr:phosphodiester glycosidase family protein [Eubacteriales bacterium]
MGNNFIEDGHDRYSHASRKSTSKRKKNKKKRVLLIIVIDILLVGIGLCVFALFHHVLPKNLEIDEKYASYTAKATDTSAAATPGTATQETGTVETQTGETTTAEANAGTWNFADKFTTGEPVITDNSYISEDINITIERVQQISDSYSITYYVADIYVRNIENFLTAFADDTYGKSITDMPLNMATQNDAIIAVSGDYYGNTDDGVVIRNGQPYRADNGDEDVLIMYTDGSMETFSPDEFDMDAALEKGAYQGWSFGPMLLDDGKAMETFNCTVNPRNPRCALGYYEPGHYCFVMVDGRQPGYSDGMTTKEISQLFEDLGCAAAYNMDGGQSAYMVFMGEVVNQPFDGGRPISDIVYIGEVQE